MNLPQRIQRKRTKGWKQPENTCYCGRGSKWGNLFTVGRPLYSWGKALLTVAVCKHPNAYIEIFNSDLFAGITTLEKSLEYYELWLDMQIKNKSLDLIELLKYDYLSCWCPLDKKCHVDILINKLQEEQK
jgi:hypothetical protein